MLQCIEDTQLGDLQVDSQIWRKHIWHKKRVNMNIIDNKHLDNTHLDNKHLRLLTDIAGAIVEYDLHLERNRLVNFIDLYRAYLQHLYGKHRQLDANTSQATFQQFIFDQTLLDKAASAVTLESGETVTAPIALHFQKS